MEERDDGASASTSSVFSSVSPSLRSFLNHEFKSVDDLSRAPALLARLSSDLVSCEDRLSHLQAMVLEKLASWSRHSHSLSSSLSDVTERIHGLLHSTDRAAIHSVSKKDSQADLVNQLPILAGEVARVERVRLYAETALRLEALVGDLEDAVSSIVMVTPIHLPRKMAKSPSSDVIAGLNEKFSIAIRALREIEDVVTKMMISWPQWKRLCLTVDVRVDGAIASLRPSAIADYRVKLAAIGWPPPLSAGSTGGGDDGNPNLGNPLLEMHGDIKARFEQSFVTLSTLQAIQCRRKSRQLNEFSNDGDDSTRMSKKFKVSSSQHELLWTVDELVAPIGSRAEYHFLKWEEKPDLIFGLSYRIAQQYVDTVDLVLQPMLDRVRLPGYCVREEWVSAIVVMVVKHLRLHVLGKLAGKVSEEESSHHASALWLHIVDLVMAFDKKMLTLASQSVGPLASNSDLDLSVESGVLLQAIIKCMSAFAENRDTLELWAHLELADAQKKLGLELQKESAWLARKYDWMGVGNVDNFGDEDSKAPQSALIAMSKLWALINRCRSLDQPERQLVFIQCVCFPFVNNFLGGLLQRCQEAEAMTALAEESAVVKVAVCIAAAYYCEHKMQEWSEDVFFLDLRVLQVAMAEDPELEGSRWIDPEIKEGKGVFPVDGSIFDEELAHLRQFRTEWLQKLVFAIQRAFDALSQDYQRNKKRWQDDINATGLALPSTSRKPEVSKQEVAKETKGESLQLLDVSPNLVDALAVLQSRLSVLKDILGDAMFVGLWRGLTSILDQLIFNALVISGTKFSIYGGRQFARDVEALLHIFKPFCLRPASFFPNLSDAVLLLTLPREEAAALQKALSLASNWRIRKKQEEDGGSSLRECGVRHISPGTAGKILSNRTFSKS